MNHTVSTLENPLKIKFTKRTIARLLTELRNRDINGDPKQATTSPEQATTSPEQATTEKEK
jgi:hypothetical protein